MSKLSGLRFDHREVAVIFSLFVFVSLLMFTVGILVGKSLTQAKYEGALALQVLHQGVDTHGDSHTSTSSHPEQTTSVSTHSESPNLAGMGHHADTEHPPSAKSAGNNEEAPDVHSDHPSGHDTKPLELTPKDEDISQYTGGSLKEPKLEKEMGRAFKDPKVAALLDDGGGDLKPTRSLSQVSPPTRTPSFASGKYTVQVGAYTTEADAQERVTHLQKLGFPFAFFSVKEGAENKATWYRVWLGYYPSYETAKKSGELLQDLGEAKNFIVKKSDNTN